MGRILMMLLFLTAAAMGAGAQNSIDALVEKYSGVGRSTFTSAVERDPATRKVQKVVKVLKKSGQGGDHSAFRNAFRKEASTGTFEESSDGEYITMLLTVENPKATRIYMLKYKQNHPAGTLSMQVTIIIKYK